MCAATTRDAVADAATTEVPAGPAQAMAEVRTAGVMGRTSAERPNTMDSSIRSKW